MQRLWSFRPKGGDRRSDRRRDRGTLSAVHSGRPVGCNILKLNKPWHILVKCVGQSCSSHQLGTLETGGQIASQRHRGDVRDRNGDGRDRRDRRSRSRWRPQRALFLVKLVSLSEGLSFAFK